MEIGQLSTKLVLVLAVAFSITTQFHASDKEGVSKDQHVRKSCLSAYAWPLLGGFVGCGCASLRKGHIDAQFYRVQGLVRATAAQSMKLKSSKTVKNSNLDVLVRQEQQWFNKKSEAMSPLQGAKIGVFGGTLITIASCKNSK